MVLVVGALASGKRNYVRSLGFDDTQMGRLPFDGTPVLCGLDEVLRDGPLTDKALEDVTSREVVICCEVGMGVVPMDGHERAWRELVGRTCSTLASRADKVVRMVCGIPVTIKEELNHE